MSRRIRSRSRYSDDEIVVGDEWGSRRIVERKGDSTRITIQSDRRRSTLDGVVNEYNDQANAGKSRSSRRQSHGRMRSRAPREEEAIIRRERRSPASPPPRPRAIIVKERVARAVSPTRSTRRYRERDYYDEYEDEEQPMLDSDAWLVSDISSDSEYSLRLADESDEEEKKEEEQPKTTVSDTTIKPDDHVLQAEKLNSTVDPNHEHLRVFPTKYARSSDIGQNAATSIIIEASTNGNLTNETQPTLSRNSTVSNSPVLFRWVHMKPENMNFKRFKEFVLDVAEVPDNSRKELRELLEAIEDQVTPLETQAGRGRQLDPYIKCTFEKERLPPSQTNTLIWLCFPYFSLERYTGVRFPEGSLEHPARTLMQLYDSASSKRRELQQAVTKHDGAKSDECFHVSQFWCLIINQSLIVTCARLTIDELRGNDLKLLPSVYPFPDSIKSQTKDSSPYLYLYDGGNCIYLIPADRCRTWFEFIAQLAELGPSDSYQVFENRTLVNSSNWNELGIVQRAKLAPVHLTLRPIKSTVHEGIARSIAPGRRRSPSMDPSSPSDESDGNTRHSDCGNGVGQKTPSQKEVPVAHVTESAPKAHPSKEQQVKDGSAEESPQTHAAPPAVPTGKSSETATSAKPTDKNEPATKSKALSEHTSTPETPLRSNTFNSLPELDWTADLQTFRVFTWLCAVKAPNTKAATQSGPSVTGNKDGEEVNNASASQTMSIDRTRLSDTLKRLHAFLWSNKRSHERYVYKKCQGKSYKEFTRCYADDVDRYRRQSRLKSPKSRVSTSHSRDRRDLLDEKRMRPKQARLFVEYAETLFQLFLPLQHESSVAHKFWGGVYRIASQILFDPDESNTGARLKQFGDLSKVASDMSEGLSNARGPSPSQIAIPSALYQAFISAVIFVVGFQPSQDRSYRWRRYIDECLARIRKGKVELVNRFSCGELSNQEAVLPVGILALNLGRLLQDVTYRQPDLLYQAYRDYLNRLETRIRIDPKNRHHQVKIVYVKQELSVIVGVIEQQQQVLGDLRRALGPEGTASTSSSFNLTEGREISTLLRALTKGRRKLVDFTQLARKADDMLANHSLLIEVNKDKQEAASLIFAIVAVIFLPLTTVASILGMNTREVRDMQQTQWIFWATGLPLAILTGFLCLWVTSQLDEFWTWLKDRLRIRPRKRVRPRRRGERSRSRSRANSWSSGYSYYTDTSTSTENNYVFRRSRGISDDYV